MIKLLPLLFLMGCSGVTVTDIDMKGRAVECQAIEARTSMLNTQGAILCFDTAGNLAGMTGGPGAPAVQVPLVVIEATGLIVGGALVGKGLSELGSIEHSGGVDLDLDSSELLAPLAPFLE